MNNTTIIEKFLNRICVDDRIEEGIFFLEDNNHMDILQEYLEKYGIPKQEAQSIRNKVAEGRFPERQAYNKNGILVTFPTPEYKQRAIQRGTHYEKNPTSPQSNVQFGNNRTPAAAQSSLPPAASPPPTETPSSNQSTLSPAEPPAPTIPPTNTPPPATAPASTPANPLPATRPTQADAPTATEPPPTPAPATQPSSFPIQTTSGNSPMPQSPIIPKSATTGAAGQLAVSNVPPTQAEPPVPIAPQAPQTPPDQKAAEEELVKQILVT